MLSIARARRNAEISAQRGLFDQLVWESCLPPRILRTLEAANPRIRRAKNPDAYRQAIISIELRLMKAPKPAPPIPLSPTTYNADAEQLAWAQDFQAQLKATGFRKLG